MSTQAERHAELILQRDRANNQAARLRSQFSRGHGELDKLGVPTSDTRLTVSLTFDARLRRLRKALRQVLTEQQRFDLEHAMRTGATEIEVSP